MLIPFLFFAHNYVGYNLVPKLQPQMIGSGVCVWVHIMEVQLQLATLNQSLANAYPTPAALPYLSSIHTGFFKCKLCPQPIVSWTGYGSLTDVCLHSWCFIFQFLAIICATPSVLTRFSWCQTWVFYPQTLSTGFCIWVYSQHTWMFNSSWHFVIQYLSIFNVIPAVLKISTELKVGISPSPISTYNPQAAACESGNTYQRFNLS